MSPDAYLRRSDAIKKQLQIVRRQIDRHVSQHGNAESDLIRPLIVRRQEIIKELTDLDEKFFCDDQVEGRKLSV